MIAIIHIERDHIHFLAFSLALFFTLVGWSVFHYQQEEQKAQAVRDFRAVVALERRLERYEQVASFYEGVRPAYRTR